MRFKLNLLFLFLTVQFAFGQEMHVSGTVYDSTGSKPLFNSMVMAVRVRDSLLLGFTRTDKNGAFVLKGFEIDTFSLVVEHPAYDEKTYYIFGHKENFEVNIPSIKMPIKSQEVEEVVIYAYKDPIYYKGDTLVYVADSFKVNEGAVVEELLKKLPGLTVDKDGKIKSQGQDISKVLVDGDEFFGTDPTIATKNLGADGIETVQVYEKENEDGIGGSDEKIKVLDLKLKEEAKKGYFGRVSGASDFTLTPKGPENTIGTDPFYEGELLLNKFSSTQKISVFALASNTPRSNFGWGDQSKFGLENETSTGNRWNPQSQGNTSGIPQTLKAGVYFNDKFGKKKGTKFGFNYSYYNDKLDAISASESAYFLADTTYYTNDSTRNYTANESHRINLSVKTEIDSLTSFEIRPSISINKGYSELSDFTKFIGESGIQSLSTENSNINDSQGANVDLMARFNRKFKKKKRELEFKYDLALTDNETDGSLNTLTLSSFNSLYNDTIDQSKINDNSSTQHTGKFTYVEPLLQKFKLEFEYLYEYGFSNQDKRTYDFGGTSYDMLRTDLSNEFDNVRQVNRGGLKLIFEQAKHTLAIGSYYRNILLDNINKITDSVVNQNINNFLPNLRYEFKPSMSKRFSFNYRTSSDQPRISDLQPVPDNTNPNRIKEGNPDLVPNYIHNVNVMFNKWSALSGRYVWMGGNFLYKDNDFATETNYDQFGRTVSKTINVDGNMFAALYGGAGLPILGRKLEFTPGINASFFRNTNYITGLKNVTDNYSIEPSLTTTLRLDSLEVNLSASYAYNNPVSSLSGSSNTPYSKQEYRLNYKWQLPKGFIISSEGVYTKNAQPGGNGLYDIEYFVLNAEIGKKFLKTGNLLVSLIGNDILNQNINARREVQGNIITDYRTTIISRYFLLKVTLRFNNNKTKEEDFNGWN